MPKVTFTHEGVFYKALRIEVDDYFKKSNIKKTGNWKLYLKTLVLVSLALFTYLMLLSVKFPLPVGICISCLLGLDLALVGFNTMHDAGHRSYSSRSWVNNLFGLTINALGGNAFIWKCKHYLHHTYTNIDGMDDDIAKSPVLRQCTSQVWMPAHRYQHFYIIVLYAFSGLIWITIFDFTKYFKKMVNTMPLKKMLLGDHLIFWTSKLMFVLFYIIIPAYFIGTGKWVIELLFMQISMGYALSIVFQLAHVVEETEFTQINNEPNFIQTEWAIHQLKSTANFSMHNKFITWCVGGLNYQIEHHLFPKICHIHYPAISKIVSSVCNKFNLPYNVFPGMLLAITSHYKLIKKLGRNPAGYY